MSIPLFASRLLFTVDSQKSTLAVTLSARVRPLIGSVSDTATQSEPLDGCLRLEFDDDFDPGRLAFRHFRLAGSTNYNLTLFGELLTATAEGVEARYPTQSTSEWSPLVDHNFHVSLPYSPGGTAAFEATGWVCDILESVAFCQTSVDLSRYGGVAESQGTLFASNGVFYLAMELTFSNSFISEPHRVDLAGKAIIRASAPTGRRLIAPGAQWRYWDWGAAPDPGWQGLDYQDSEWPVGCAPLGYGGRDESTTLNPGNAHYFRRSIEVEEPSALTNLTFKVLRSDGVLIYLNGVEVLRDNMPSGPIDFATPALRAITRVDESRLIIATIPPGLLKYGPNVIASEIHQAGSVGLDAVMDLELFGAPAPLLPRLFIARSAEQVVLRWYSSLRGYELERRRCLRPDCPWESISDLASDDGEWQQVILITTDAECYYQLRKP